MLSQPPDGRLRRKLEAMRRVQTTALDLFETHGFDLVTIEQIALQAQVSVPTVYRNFGTKERIVLWDEYDPALLASVARHLDDQPVLRAMPLALSESLGPIYRDDAERILRRARLTFSHPSLVAASGGERELLANALAELFHAKRACADPFAAQVVAHAVVATLTASVQRWVKLNARVSLGKIIEQAFARLIEATVSTP